MEQELELKLVKKYPKIFKEYGGNPQETCLSWGLECEKGWYNIIDNLCYLIQRHVDNPRSVCVDSKFVKFLKNTWNRTAWNKVIYPLGRKFGPIKDVPYSYSHGHPKYKEYSEAWKNWYKFQNKWQFEIKYVKPPYDESRQVVATQIKEKFGTLCFYYNGGDDYIRGLVSMAETMSNITCEYCGSTKDIKKTTGWIKTLCSECYNKTRMNVKSYEI